MQKLLRQRAALIVASLFVLIAAPAAAQDGAAPGAAPSPFEEAIAQSKSNMMADSAVALQYAREAEGLVDGDSDEAAQSRLTAQWLEAEALMRLNRADEAASIIDGALTEIEANFAGSKLHADLMRSKASLNVSQSKFGVALSSYLAAHELYEALGEDRSRAIVLQNIGSLYSDARDYHRVLNYYRQASEAFPEDPNLALSAHNNKGNAYKELERFSEAEAEFRSALVVAEQMGSPLLEARILTNIASTQYLAGEYAAAEATVNRGLAIADAGASEWKPFLYGVKAQLALVQGQTGMAEQYIVMTFGDEDLTATSPFFRDFHDTAYMVYEQSGNYRLANEHLTAFHRIETQAQNLSSAANNALLSARFDAENRDLQIEKLSFEKSAAQNQVLLLSSVVALVILAFIGALFLLRMVNRSRKGIKEANEKLTHVIQHDGLTGVHSRDHFHTLFKEASEQRLNTDQPAILGFVDLDRFKQINDLFGHAAGDQLLIEFAQRFTQTVGDKAIVGRLGGDEFAFIMPAGMSMEQSVALSHNLIREVSRPYSIDGDIMNIGASIGLTEISELASTSVHMTNADLALYAAKDAGRGTCVVYESAMRDELSDRSSLEKDLESAVENGEMSIFYQPIVKGADSQIMGYEALMRWTHPTRGVVPPSTFIPLAEEARIIDRLGSWMLQTACAEAALWPDKTKLCVNISTLQMGDPAFLKTATQALANSGLEPERLILEVTETMVLELNDDVERLLASLKTLGVSFALDDFGRGYSSLNYIEKMDFSMIKIDREFVQSAAAGSTRCQAIVTAIVALAQSLDIDVTAEGIENADQAKAMKDLGCSCLQGFHFGRPKAYAVDTEKAAKRAAA